MMPTNVLLNIVFVSLCIFFKMTDTRTSTMWKLNSQTGRIEKHNIMTYDGDRYSFLDENMLFNFDAMADVYSNDKKFFTIVSSTRIGNQNGWLRQSTENTLKSLLQARKTIHSKNAKKSKVFLSSNYNNIYTLDCGQLVNYSNYDYIDNLGTHYRYKGAPTMPEPDVILFFSNSQYQENYTNFNIEDLEKRLRHLRKENPLSAELYHHIGNYWRIVGSPVEAIKCFQRSLDILPTASEVMYDLAKVLYNLQYLDDAINMTRRSIEFQAPSLSAWRQYLLLGDIFKTYGDLRASLHWYRRAFELNPTQDLVLRSLIEAEQKPVPTLHVYTIVIIVFLVIMVLTVILKPVLSEVGVRHNYITGHSVGNSEFFEKPQRHFNRAMAMRSLKGYSITRSSRQRKY